MDITIRKVEEKDAGIFQTIRVTVWKDAYAHIFPESVFENQQKKLSEYIANTPKRLLDDNFNYYLAEVDKKPVAIMVVAKISEYEHYASLGYADLQALYILPHYQGLGIGTKLFKYAVNLIADQGAEKMVIGVLKDNQMAQKAYKKWGGKLDNYEQPFVKEGKNYAEVFYIYEPLDKFR